MRLIADGTSVNPRERPKCPTTIPPSMDAASSIQSSAAVPRPRPLPSNPVFSQTTTVPALQGHTHSKYLLSQANWDHSGDLEQEHVQILEKIYNWLFQPLVCLLFL